jgi:hypothetical protein
MADELKKKVDESWKERAEKEKAAVEKTPKQESKEPKEEEDGYELPPEPNFGLFVYNMGMQGLMFLGEIENPVTKRKEKNLTQAKYIIDIIEMLKEKTKGNLTGEEANLIEELLYNLRLKFVAANK